MNCVRELVGRSPSKSLQNIQCASVQRILRDDLHLFLYKIQLQRELTPKQNAQKFEFAQWFSGKLETDEHFFEKMFITDECHAHLSGLVNKQNVRYWGLTIQEMNL